MADLKNREEFILEEKESEKTHDETSEKKKKGSLRNLFSKSANSEKKDSESGKESNNTENMTCVSKNLKENVEYLKKRFSIPINGDVVLFPHALYFMTEWYSAAPYA